MLFNHIHYKQALFFFLYHRKRPKVCHESILLVLRCISGILLNICRGFVNSHEILSFFVTEFDQIRDSYVYIVMRCGYFVPDADVSDYIMLFFFLLICKVVHNQIVQFRYQESCLDRLYAMCF